MNLEEMLVSKLGLSPEGAKNARRQFGANSLAFLVSSPFGPVFDFLWVSPSTGKLTPTRRMESPFGNYAELVIAASRGDAAKVRTAANQVAVKLDRIARTGAGATLKPEQRAEFRSWIPRLRAIGQNPQPLLDAITRLREVESVQAARTKFIKSKILQKQKIMINKMRPKELLLNKALVREEIYRSKKFFNVFLQEFKNEGFERKGKEFPKRPRRPK